VGTTGRSPRRDPCGHPRRPPSLHRDLVVRKIGHPVVEVVGGEGAHSPGLEGRPNVLVDRLAVDFADRPAPGQLAPHVLGVVVVPEVEEERDQLLACVPGGGFLDGDLALLDLFDGPLEQLLRRGLAEGARRAVLTTGGTLKAIYGEWALILSKCRCILASGHKNSCPTTPELLKIKACTG
jgi:hypothetical protein